MFSHTSSRFNAKLAVGLAVLSCSAGFAADSNPAQFPIKASAILVQGSSDDPGWLNDVNAMNGLFTNANYNYVYGIQQLTVGGAGASQTTTANVQSAIQNSGTAMWLSSVGSQNFVYYNSAHGGPGTGNKNSTIDFNNTDVSADTFTGWVKNNLPQGHTQYSTDGTTNTTCVRSMTYILDDCFAGGYVYDLTTLLADPATRKANFPFLSDITVMTAADYNECAITVSSGTPGAFGAFSGALYGYTRPDNSNVVAGSLATKTPGSEWDVYNAAAQNCYKNPAATTPAYAINAAFGTGDNATMYTAGTQFGGVAGNTQHPVYRHVRFYPALTLIPALPDPTMGVPLNAEPNSLDLRLNAPQAPGNGPVPMTLSIFGVPSTDTLMVSRQKNTWDQNLPEPISLDQFVNYYIFQLSMLNGSTYTGGSISIYYNQLTDPTQIAVNPFDIFEEISPDSGWIDLSATQNYSDQSVTADLNGSLGEFALVIVPEPAQITLLGLTIMAVGRRRRST